MPIEHQTTILRKHLQAKPDTLFVYGDTLEGGPILAARECRGEPNAVPIPAMRAGGFEEPCYLTDADFDAVKPIVQDRFRQLAMHIMSGGKVCFPTLGVECHVGGGLRQRAPRIDHFITRCYRHLMSEDIKANYPGALGPARSQ